ncbi:hypothetical protein HDU97_003965 [Phlyctochytrium planicorne]|nr:hypothetical protein HDU97_003965 [Phlyctochytrium planicorne]
MNGLAENPLLPMELTNPLTGDLSGAALTRPDPLAAAKTSISELLEDVVEKASTAKGTCKSMDWAKTLQLVQQITISTEAIASFITTLQPMVSIITLWDWPKNRFLFFEPGDRNPSATLESLETEKEVPAKKRKRSSAEDSQGSTGSKRSRLPNSEQDDVQSCSPPTSDDEAGFGEDSELKSKDADEMQYEYSYIFEGQPKKWTGDIITPEVEEKLDVVFFMYLARICGDWDASDSTGTKIHMTLVGKKLENLKMTVVFDTFKFRPYAFVNGFKDELRQEEPELADLKNTGLVKAYLSRQRFLARYTKDNKKFKTKGAPVIVVEAKKTEDGGWIFKEFEKRISPPHSNKAKVGNIFMYKPELIDPQLGGDRPVKYSFPNLPSWLTWNNDALLGTPTENDSSFELVVQGLYGHHDLDQNVVLTAKFSIYIVK